MIGFSIQFVAADEKIDWPAAEVSSHVKDDLAVAILDKGMQTGRPSVMLRVPLEDGTVALVETSARVLCAIAAAIHGKYPDLLVGD